MKLMNIKDVKSGDILEESIVTFDGYVMLKRGVSLTDLYISKLINMGIEYIYIKDQNYEDIKPIEENFLELKVEILKAYSQMFTNIQEGIIPKYENIKNKIEDMVDFLGDFRDLNSTYLLELKTFDNYTYMHSLNVTLLSLFFGTKMKFSKDKLLELGVAAILHDIGKTKIPISILNKNTRLSDKEFEIMKRHTVYGYEIACQIKGLKEESKLATINHHEKVDGSGYPRGLRGNEIDIYSKIICISDVYDAVASDRVYRKAFSVVESYEYILAGSGSLFDPDLVKIFKENFSIYPLGMYVKLSNGVDGIVTKHNNGFPDRPIVRVLLENGKKEEVNLLKNIDICIVQK